MRGRRFLISRWLREQRHFVNQAAIQDGRLQHPSHLHQNDAYFAFPAALLFVHFPSTSTRALNLPPQRNNTLPWRLEDQLLRSTPHTDQTSSKGWDLRLLRRSTIPPPWR